MLHADEDAQGRLEEALQQLAHTQQAGQQQQSDLDSAAEVVQVCLQARLCAATPPAFLVLLPVGEGAGSRPVMWLQAEAVPPDQPVWLGPGPAAAPCVMEVIIADRCVACRW